MLAYEVYVRDSIKENWTPRDWVSSTITNGMGLNP